MCYKTQMLQKKYKDPSTFSPLGSSTQQHPPTTLASNQYHCVHVCVYPSKIIVLIVMEDLFFLK